MKVAVVQYDIAWENPTMNRAKISNMLKTLQGTKVDWLIFPEATLTGFSMDHSRTELSDDDHNFFCEISKELDCYVTYGAFHEKKNKVFTIFSDDNIEEQYAKMHLFSYAGEQSIYKAGQVQNVFKVKDFNVMPTICYDLRFSYLYWDKAKEVDVFLVAANWPESRKEHWITLLKARAIENQCFVIGVNRIGKDPKVSYSGDSMVIDPFGRIILDCGRSEGVFKTELERALVAETREKYPFINDRIKKS